jgi:hypothetical protein
MGKRVMTVMLIIDDRNADHTGGGGSLVLDHAARV